MHNHTVAWALSGARRSGKLGSTITSLIVSYRRLYRLGDIDSLSSRPTPNAKSPVLLQLNRLQTCTSVCARKPRNKPVRKASEHYTTTRRAIHHHLLGDYSRASTSKLAPDPHEHLSIQTTMTLPPVWRI